jgi:hypothetical protein
MIYPTIILPFVTLRCISRPLAIDRFEEMYDFTIPMRDTVGDRSFSIFYQADVDKDVLATYSENEAIGIATKEIESHLAAYMASRDGTVKISREGNRPVSISDLVASALFKNPFRKSVICAFPNPDGSKEITYNLKMPRGVTMFITPDDTWPEDSVNNSITGDVTILGVKSKFFFRKTNANLKRHVSAATLQEEFMKAMKDSFPFFSLLGPDQEKPWDAKLHITS